MPQFVIEREIQGAGSLTEEQIREVSLRSLRTLKQMGSQIQWLHSYVTEDKVYCVYIAPDENIIREHAAKAGIPADRVSAVRRLIDPNALQYGTADLWIPEPSDSIGRPFPSPLRSLRPTPRLLPPWRATRAHIATSHRVLTVQTAEEPC